MFLEQIDDLSRTHISVEKRVDSRTDEVIFSLMLRGEGGGDTR